MLMVLLVVSSSFSMEFLGQSNLVRYKYFRLMNKQWHGWHSVLLQCCTSLTAKLKPKVVV